MKALNWGVTNHKSLLDHEKIYNLGSLCSKAFVKLVMFIIHNFYKAICVIINNGLIVILINNSSGMWDR